MPMYSACGNAALPALGFPIRESTGQRLFNASPWLIAVVHALHRLLVPRHPPCALDILTVIESLEPKLVEIDETQFLKLASCAVFKVRKRSNGGASAAGLSKLSSARAPAPQGRRIVVA